MPGNLKEWLSRLPTRPLMAIFVILFTGAATLAAFTKNLSTIFNNLADAAEQVQFLGVAHRYVRPGGGQFVRLSDGYWVEVTKGQLARFVFQELRRDKDFIYLYDSSRVRGNDPADPIVVRIPKDGGVVQWSYAKSSANSSNWNNLFVACRDRCRGDLA